MIFHAMLVIFMLSKHYIFVKLTDSCFYVTIKYHGWSYYSLGATLLVIYTSPKWILVSFFSSGAKCQIFVIFTFNKIVQTNVLSLREAFAITTPCHSS